MRSHVHVQAHMQVSLHVQFITRKNHSIFTSVLLLYKGEIFHGRIFIEHYTHET